jgi:hypothetical protein
MPGETAPRLLSGHLPWLQEDPYEAARSPRAERCMCGGVITAWGFTDAEIAAAVRLHQETYPHWGWAVDKGYIRACARPQMVENSGAAPE